MHGEVLIVEDDTSLRDVIAEMLRRRGRSSQAVSTVAEAIAAIDERSFRLVLVDLRLPDGDGVEVVRAVRRADPRSAIIVMTGFGSIEEAVRAVREGAYDFLAKPLDPAQFALAIDRALEARMLRAEVDRLRDAVVAERVEREVVGRSRAMADIVALVQRVADSPTTVLITGASGTGKERVARALHAGSRRASAPFVAVNMAAVPDALLESELFGFVRGAFTDAKNDRRGLLLEADGGTLFLDEVGDLPLALQAKLLRVLQEREVRPIGSNRAVAFDVRVIGATHHDLRAMIAQGRFREDLFYRLAVLEIVIPPLRDRREDVVALAACFLEKYGGRARHTIRGFSDAAVRRLLGYGWPGNVRELENVVERAVALATDEWISPDDLPASVREEAPADVFAAAAERSMTLEQVQTGYVHHVLERLGNNKKRAAEFLGVNRRTIQRWLGETAPESTPESPPDTAEVLSADDQPDGPQ